MGLELRSPDPLGLCPPAHTGPASCLFLWVPELGIVAAVGEPWPGCGSAGELA